MTIFELVTKKQLNQNMQHNKGIKNISELSKF